MSASQGNPSEAATILMPAPTEQAAAEEFQRALEDAVGVSYLCVKEPFVVNGAGSIQARMSSHIKSLSAEENPKVEAKTSLCRSIDDYSSNFSRVCGHGCDGCNCQNDNRTKPRS